MTAASGADLKGPLCIGYSLRFESAQHEAIGPAQAKHEHPHLTVTTPKRRPAHRAKLVACSHRERLSALLARLGGRSCAIKTRAARLGVAVPNSPVSDAQMPFGVAAVVASRCYGVLGCESQDQRRNPHGLGPTTDHGAASWEISGTPNFGLMPFCVFRHHRPSLAAPRRPHPFRSRRHRLYRTAEGGGEIVR